MSADMRLIEDDDCQRVADVLAATKRWRAAEQMRQASRQAGIGRPSVEADLAVWDAINAVDAALIELAEHVESRGE